MNLGKNTSTHSLACRFPRAYLLQVDEAVYALDKV